MYIYIIYTHTYITYTFTDICFCIIKTQDFKQVLHKLHGQSLQTHCQMFFVKWLKELVSLRDSGKIDQS